MKILPAEANLVANQWFIQRPQGSLVVILPIKVSGIRRHSFHGDYWNAAYVFFRFGEKRLLQILLNPQSQRRLAYAGRTDHEHQRPSGEFLDSSFERDVRFFQQGMSNRVRSEICDSFTYRAVEELARKAFLRHVQYSSYALSSPEAAAPGIIPAFSPSETFC